jgi:septal ring factor EnvC (AmiA/AmiB activator)
MDNGSSAYQNQAAGLALSGMGSQVRAVTSDTIREDIKQRLRELSKQSELFAKLESEHRSRLDEIATLQDTLKAINSPRAVPPEET